MSLMSRQDVILSITDSNLDHLLSGSQVHWSLTFSRGEDRIVTKPSEGEFSAQRISFVVT